MAVYVGDTVQLDFRFRRADNGNFFAPSDVTITLISPSLAVTTDTGTQVGTTLIFRRTVTLNAAGTWLAYASTTDPLASGGGQTDAIQIDVDSAVSGDPLLSTVPGAYAVNTAGYNLGLLPAIKARTDLISTGSIVLIPSYLARTHQLFMYRGDTKALVITGLSGDLLDATNVKLSARKKGATGVPLAALTGTVVDNTTLSWDPTQAFYDLLPDGEPYIFDVQVTLSNGRIFSPIQHSDLVLIDDITKTPP